MTLRLAPTQRAQALGPRISISSFSLRSELGDIRVAVETEQGTVEELVLAHQSRYRMTELPGLVRSRLGLDAVELCQFQLGPVLPNGVAELAAALQQHAVEVTTVPIDVGNIANPDDVTRLSYLAEIREWMDIAADLGAAFARVNAGAPIGARNSSRPALVSALRSLADYASTIGIGLLVENHGGLSSDPEWLAELISDVGPDRLGLILDTGNFEPMLAASNARFAGHPIQESTLDFEPLYDSLARLAPMATLVHAKAFDVAADGTTAPIDLHRCLVILRDGGFDGPITIEFEGEAPDPWVCVASMVATVREVFDRTGPSAAPRGRVDDVGELGQLVS